MKIDIDYVRCQKYLCFALNLQQQSHLVPKPSSPPPPPVQSVMEVFDLQSSNLSAYTADVFWHGSLRLPASFDASSNHANVPLDNV